MSQDRATGSLRRVVLPSTIRCARAALVYWAAVSSWSPAHADETAKGPGRSATKAPANPQPLPAVGRSGTSSRRDSERPLDALRRFEERAFAKPPARAAGVVVGDDSAKATWQPRRRTPLDPPDWLRTHIQGDTRVAPLGHAKGVTRLRMPDIRVQWDDKLVQYLEFYRADPRGRRIISIWLQRMGRYEQMIRRQLREQGLPQTLIYVAMVESAFDPLRTSPVGAAGMWQFMMPTARAYGLQRDHWIDERRNPELATRAALRYLKSLKQRLGSWELALAAYNAGFGAVVESLQKYNTNDYWRLCRYESGLPWSTTLYVPKILAVAIVGLNREAFGFARVRADPGIRFDLAHVRVSATTAQLARAAGVDPDVITRLNPELRRGRTPPRSLLWVRVPKGRADRFYRQLSAIKRSDAVVRPYDVKLGDSLASIAERFGTSILQLRRLNRLRSTREVRPGLTLFVPAVPQRRQRSAKQPEQQDLSVVVPLAQGCPSQVPGKRRVFYRTVLGDTLTEIAHYLGTSTEQLIRWNALSKDARIVSNMVLQAFVSTPLKTDQVVLLDPSRVVVVAAGSEHFLQQHERRKGRRRVVYTVRRGDNLSRVARRFGLSVGSIMRINQFGRDTKLVAGQQIVVYVKASAKPKRPRKPHRSRGDV